MRIFSRAAPPSSTSAAPLLRLLLLRRRHNPQNTHHQHHRNIIERNKHKQRAAAEKVLKAYQDHPDAWARVDAILDKASTQQTKFFALQVLEAAVKFRWGALPAEQREGVKNYVSNLIIKYATNEQLFR